MLQGAAEELRELRVKYAKLEERLTHALDAQLIISHGSPTIRPLSQSLSQAASSLVAGSWPLTAASSGPKLQDGRGDRGPQDRAASLANSLLDHRIEKADRRKGTLATSLLAQFDHRRAGDAREGSEASPSRHRALGTSPRGAGGGGGGGGRGGEEEEEGAVVHGAVTRGSSSESDYSHQSLL